MTREDVDVIGTLSEETEDIVVMGGDTATLSSQEEIASTGKKQTIVQEEDLWKGVDVGVFVVVARMMAEFIIGSRGLPCLSVFF